MLGLVAPGVALCRIGITPVLLTGDNRRAATHIAAQVGIGDVHAEVHPDRKAAIVRDLQYGGQRVAMVGEVSMTPQL